MSLGIDVDAVTAILLADGWHDVLDDSFELDAYEYLWSGREGTSVADLRGRDPLVLHSGGTGFACRTPDGWTAGPVSSLLAVRYST